MNLDSVLEIDSTSLNLNNASSSGGVVATASDNHCIITIVGATFSNNSAVERGGCLFVAQATDSSLQVNDTSFSGNSAAFGGAISVENFSHLPSLYNVTFSGNTASVYGPDVNSPPRSIHASISTLEFYSGSAIPLFQVSLLDNFGNVYTQTPTQPFNVCAILNNFEKVR